MSGRLAGKTVIVTGGNSGIGAAIVDLAAAEGANVVIDFVARLDVADQMEHQLDAAAGRNDALAVQADVSTLAGVEALIAGAVKEFGRLDVMVNNAGVETRQSVLDTTEADFDKVMTINLKSAFFGTQLAAKQMLAQAQAAASEASQPSTPSPSAPSRPTAGVIINISSVHEDWPMPGNAAYCVSKGGMRMLTRNSACELGPLGIRVVGVGPGAVATPINASTLGDPQKMRSLDAAIPLGRMARPEEIAQAVVFAASDEGSYLTATTLFVDGGIMMGSLGL